MPRSRLFLGLTLLLVMLVLPMTRLPTAWLPWGEIDLNAKVGWFTGARLAALRDDGPACRQALIRAGIGFQLIPDRAGGNCPLENMVALEPGRYQYSTPVRGNCGLAAALAVWERQVVAPAAARYLPAPVRGIDHLGLYACRTVRGSLGRVSEHAAANAIDISGFRLGNGQRIDIARDWGRETPAGHFLRAVRDGSCGLFRAVLGPDYNALHHDHFHLDLGRFSICR